MNSRINVLIPMAGRGERFSSVGYDLPKPLIEINGRPMIEWALRSLDVDFYLHNFIFVVRDYQNDEINNRIASVLTCLVPNNKIVKIDYVTEGPACTCLLVRDMIDNDSPLMVGNCDQIMRWNGSYFVSSCLNSPYDGVVVTYDESTPKNSYAKLNSRGDVIRIEEKNVISNVSLNGIHFWKHGSDFVSSADSMIESNERYNNEFYVGPTYNHMIKTGKRVGIFHIPRECHNPVGVPSDLGDFLEKNK
jgi:NDP-sugar pyrophosphorylase family protein